MTSDEQHCLERLEYHESRLDTLVQLLGRSGRVVGRDDALTRELYRSIKTGLTDEAYRSDTAGGVTALTDAETIWYQTDVAKAYLELQAPTTAILDRQLLANVGQARGTIRHALVQLRAHLGIKSEGV